MVGNFRPLEFDQQDNFQMLKYIIIDVIVQSCRNAIKVRVEWADNYSGFISLMEVLDDLRFWCWNGVDVGPHFLTVSKRTLKKIMIILLYGSSGYFSE